MAGRKKDQEAAAKSKKVAPILIVAGAVVMAFAYLFMAPPS